VSEGGFFRIDYISIGDRDVQSSVLPGCETEKRERKKWKTAIQQLTVRFAPYI